MVRLKNSDFSILQLVVFVNDIELASRSKNLLNLKSFCPMQI